MAKSILLRPSSRFLLVPQSQGQILVQQRSIFSEESLSCLGMGLYISLCEIAGESRRIDIGREAVLARVQLSKNTYSRYMRFFQDRYIWKPPHSRGSSPTVIELIPPTDSAPMVMPSGGDVRLTPAERAILGYLYLLAVEREGQLITSLTSDQARSKMGIVYTIWRKYIVHLAEYGYIQIIQ